MTFENSEMWRLAPLDSLSKKKMMLWPRRSGRTKTVAQNAVTAATLGKKVLVVAKHSMEIDIIFEMIKDHVVYGMVRRDVTKPYYEIGLNNGGRIRGFHLTRHVGLGLCGQDADLILVDNFDYLDKAIIYGAILPMCQSWSETELEMYGVSMEYAPEDEKLIAPRMRWPRSLFHSPQVDLIRDILKNEEWETFIWPEVEDPNKTTGYIPSKQFWDRIGRMTPCVSQKDSKEEKNV